MPAKKTDWKKQALRERELLAKGTRSSAEDPDVATPEAVQEVMYRMQRGQWARQDQRNAAAPPGISKTMMERMRGLFGGGEGHPRRSRARDAGSTTGS